MERDRLKLERNRLDEWKKGHIDPSLEPRSYQTKNETLSSRRKSPSLPQLFQETKKLLKRRGKRQKVRVSARTKLKTILADSQRLYSERRRDRKTI